MPKANQNPLAKRGLSSNTVLTALVLVVAVVVIGGVLLFKDGDSGAAKGDVPPEVLRPPESHTLTEVQDSKVTVVEFLDYQCPACAQYYRNITKQIEQDYADRITFVVRNFPLDMHPLAKPAARAAEAAGMQGKFNEMYHALFDNYQSWAVDESGQTSSDLQRAQSQFDAFAEQIGLDLDQFHNDMDSQAVRQRIEKDQADGGEAGVDSTPTLFVNGSKFEPSAQSYQEVDKQLRSELDEALDS
ncbi:DsbA family protein [Amycolatopsis cihanbeyliensis]|uniref:Protein-disulfide isomerase n=1 Tax=Amycolatopsis cihanbeyliensis TaxID=1128664 RepID=A0A542DFG3_AMYCI|nr:thioredoxin domain-containing protein [Amycolatopsis cihanbeyliensis]TQJ01848.1 protein-disulfide isomerase [Amycolatopsis cihanbeyliensis]